MKGAYKTKWFQWWSRCYRTLIDLADFLRHISSDSTRSTREENKTRTIRNTCTSFDNRKFFCDVRFEITGMQNCIQFV